MSTTEQPPSTATTIARGSVREFFTRLFRERKLGAASLLVLLTFLLVGIFADYLAPHGMLDHDISRRLQGPSVEFPLGTDQFGRDQLSRIIFGARISMIVGVAASALSVVVATILGLISGYLGGRFDLIMQRFVDAVQSFPWLFLVLTIMSILGPGILQVIIVLGVPWGIVNIRTVRSVVLSIKENAYVEAARAIGARTGRILWQHIAPQIVAPIIVLFTVSLGGNIIGEATVSFLGFGIPPPTPSWGGMLSLEDASTCCRLLGWRSGPVCASRPWCTRSTCSATRCATCSIHGCGVVSGALAWRRTSVGLGRQQEVN